MIRAVGLAVILLAFTGCVVPPNSSSDVARNVTTTVEFSNPEQTIIQAYVADDAIERGVGLGTTDVLPEDTGMLFIFREAHIPAFWMKNVEYPIDIIWLQDDTIVDITEQVQPESSGTAFNNYKQYSPIVNTNQVIEVNAGFVDQHQIAIKNTIKVSY